MMKKRIFTGGTAGAVIGYIGSIYGQAQAAAAVKVRPALKDTGFIDALLTNHGGDWFFYHEPQVASVITMIVGAIAGIVAAVVWSE